MKKENQNISNPDELNKILQKTNPLVWITLGIVLLVLVLLLAWSVITTLEIKTHGTANVKSQMASIYVDEAKADGIDVGDKIYISGKEGEIVGVENDGHYTSSNIQLDDGEYDAYIVVKEIRPIEFLLGN
ncbi:MAG: hypothetical protein E7279_03190 [Lachnospiraceae bacterium]|nr:hypothetical protein [Lachnospiraceae bacterium]